MRSIRSRHHASGPAWRERIVDAPPARPPSQIAPVQTSALDLPGEQKLALVSLCRPFATLLAAAVCKCIESASVQYPRGLEGEHHWEALRREGYVTREGFSLHRVTPKGKGAGIAIMRDIAGKYGIPVAERTTLHVFTPSGGKGSGIKSTCSCGYATPFCRDSRGGESKIRAHQTGHIEEVESGAWGKRRQSLTVFLNEVVPPRLPLEHRQ